MYFAWLRVCYASIRRNQTSDPSLSALVAPNFDREVTLPVTQEAQSRSSLHTKFGSQEVAVQGSSQGSGSQLPSPSASTHCAGKERNKQRRLKTFLEKEECVLILLAVQVPSPRLQGAVDTHWPAAVHVSPSKKHYLFCEPCVPYIL